MLRYLLLYFGGGLLLFCGLLEPQPVLAQRLASLPTPREVLGFTPGSNHTIADWTQITNYFARLDRASDRVLVQSIGETTQRRSLIAVFVSAPENLRDLDKIKDIQRRLADPRRVADEAERDRLLRDGRTVVVISCSIHSTEIVASQMSMQLAYELAQANDSDTTEILRNTILILIPSANPDGIDIVAAWYRQTLGTKYEGSVPPELYHHYAGHENNRDWFMLNLKETQAITNLFWREWFPQIVYDVHQQGEYGARFFVPPFHDPPNPHIAASLLRGVGLIGHKIAADLHATGFQGITTNSQHDLWAHGEFRTAPYFHNSIGILSEAASARLMSPITVTREQLAKKTGRGMPSLLEATTNFPEPWTGGLWRPADIMRMEMIAARAVLSLAAKYRDNYLRDFYELGRRAVSAPQTMDRPLGFAIPPGQGNDESIAKLVGLLVNQGVEVYRLERELHTMPVITSWSGVEMPKAVETPVGTYLVFVNQPYRANVLALFEPQIYPERRTTGGAAEPPYDVAGWTLPMQMGVESVPIGAIRETPEERRFTLVGGEVEVRRDLGLPPRAARDAGSPIKNPLSRAVRLGVYRGWTASPDEGWTRFVFDTFNVPYRKLSDKEMRGGDLRARFDVIILPSQRAKDIAEGIAPGEYPPEFTGGITADGIAHLRRFIESGGTLICFDQSSELAIKSFDLPVRNVVESVDRTKFYCPGSILRVNVDTAHPIARGVNPTTDVYFINSSAFEVTDPARVRIVARYTSENVLRSGWLLGEKQIVGKAALVEISLGAGRVVLFGFRPQHRGQTWGTFPFIFNAIASS